MMKRNYCSTRLACLAAGLFLFAATMAARAVEPSLRGAEVFRNQCAKCHGPNGEGVKDEYDEPLVGDWSIERLTRTITRTMPEDEPKKCVGKDAEAVAHYIYHAFYSREARLRNQTARVELVRLTNRQYENTVADLLGHFTGGKTMAGKRGGLQATYYNSRSTRENKKAFERLDPQVDFDFGTNSPSAEIGAEEFAIQWRGSVIADETGDYEFVLKTPNGARLWVNDDETALIDAWVASGEQDEHTATIRLLGGRAYPLRVSFFKFKEKTASVSLQWKPPHHTRQTIPARNLSRDDISATFVVSTPFPPDDSSVGYERGAAVSKAWDEATTHAAIDVANYVAKNLNAFCKSKQDDDDRTAKVQGFAREFVQTAFRRPLSERQASLFVTNQFKTSQSVEQALKQVMLLTLKSPRFLYLGLQGGGRPDFEVASRLSFALWDSLPDRELSEAAAAGQLHTREQVVQQARRMVDDSRTRAKMLYFLHHWLQMHHVEDLAKDADLYPDFTPETIADLRTSLNLFLADAMWNYRELLLADYVLLNERLAKFYGIETDAHDAFAKVQFEPEQRSGVITHPYLLSAFSYQKSTSPIHRGVFLTRNVIGRALKPPPMAVEFKESDFSPDMTMREKVAKLTRPQACQTCHSVINPLGFSLEHFDAVGRFRTQEGNRPIDAVSDYTTDDGTVVRLKGARDLGRFAAESAQAQNGFIEQLFHQVVKQPMLAYGPDVLDKLRQSFVESDFDVRKLLLEIVAIAALHEIENPRES